MQPLEFAMPGIQASMLLSDLKISTDFKNISHMLFLHVLVLEACLYQNYKNKYNVSAALTHC